MWVDCGYIKLAVKRIIVMAVVFCNHMTLLTRRRLVVVVNIYIEGVVRY